MNSSSTRQTFQFINWLQISLGFVTAVIACYLSFSLTNLRLIDEGAKELMGMLNHGFFFLLDVERFPLVFSRLLPWTLSLFSSDLPIIMHAYSVNLLVLTGIYYLIRLSKKDYNGGVYLMGFSIAGISYTFYLQPFLEHFYAIFFCLIFLDLMKKDQKQHPKWKYILGIILIICVVCIYPTCLLLAMLSISLTHINRIARYSFWAFAILTSLIALHFSVIPVENKVESLDLSYTHNAFVYLLKQYGVLISIAAIGLSVLMKRKEWMSVILFLASMFPFLLSGQVREYQFVLAIGAITIVLYQFRDLNFSRLLGCVYAVLFFASACKIYALKPVYQGQLNEIEMLIQSARNNKVAKGILLNYSTSVSGTELEFDEFIRHASILHSSLDKQHQTVVIESARFIQKVLIGPEYEKDVISLMSATEEYFNTSTQIRLPEDLSERYEYVKYYTTNYFFNDRYFKISDSAKYKVLVME